MTDGTIPLAGAPSTGDRRVGVYATLAALACITLVYLPIIQAMMHHWRTDPDYSHGFFIVPLSLYFAYESKYKLQAAPVAGSWWGVVPLLIGVALLAIGQLGSLLTALRAGFVFSVAGLILLLLGRSIFRILFFPLAFLLLMVPLPQTVVNTIAFPLQLIAARWAVGAMHLLSIPALLEGNIIHMAKAELFVAEACSGLRSLMALLTLGVAFAHFFRRGKRVQQIILVASTIPIAIVVNSVRVALTGVLTHLYGKEAAGGIVHEFQGMITFAAALALLMAEGSLIDYVIRRYRARG